MAQRKRNTKVRYVGLPKHMIESDEFVALSPRAKALLIDVALQYNGFNNGALVASWAHMRDVRGWRSKAALSSSRKELVDTGFLVITHYQGRQKKLPTYFAITWRAVDDTEHSDPTIAAPNTWKKNLSPVFGAINPTGGPMEANFGRK